jgi:uncharacterized protein
MASTRGITYLLDVNVLIALAWPSHMHHARAHQWFERLSEPSWATCPLTQLAFVRISSNPKIIADAVSPRAAVQLLSTIVATSGHVFFADELAIVKLAGFTRAALVGHRQVTDAYLIELAKHHHAKLATLDRGIKDLLPARERETGIEFIEDFVRT